MYSTVLFQKLLLISSGRVADPGPAEGAQARGEGGNRPPFVSTEPRQARREEEHSPFSEKGLVSSCSLCLSYRVKNCQLRRVLVTAPRGGHPGAGAWHRPPTLHRQGPRNSPPPHGARGRAIKKAPSCGAFLFVIWLLGLASAQIVLGQGLSAGLPLHPGSGSAAAVGAAHGGEL